MAMDDEYNMERLDAEVVGIIEDEDAPTEPSDEPASTLSLLTEYLSMANVAEMGDEHFRSVCDCTLADIAAEVVEEYTVDLNSRLDWEYRMEQGLKLARQMKDNRTWAGEKIADVKYPTIAQAAIQYASRAYPAIVKEGEVVKHKPVGADADGLKSARGARVSQFMNWQLLERTGNWEEDMDKLLFLQPIVGTYFKKTYWDPAERRLCTELVSPEDLVIYYDALSFEKAPRKTHILYYTHNEYLEMVRAGAWLDMDLDKPDSETDGGMHTFLEQHRTLDLDGDGYEEPYVVTVHERTQKVVRIACRFERDGIVTDSAYGQTNADHEVKKIVPVECFTEYPFMPSFDGGVYGMGFGILLGPLNESINTLFNQILDAGTRSNFQGGFIGKGVRLLRGGESGTVRFQRGEWKFVQTAGDDLRKNILPLPANEPSAVLFQLLGFLVTASEKLAAQSDLLAGVQEQHNVPATSTMALMEQGLKVLGGIYKRVYRALRKEYKKVRRLDAQHVTDAEYRNIVDDQQGTVQDFATPDHDIIPMSTAAEMTEAQQYLKAQAMMGLRGQGLDDMEINKFYMEALGIPNTQRFMPKQPPQPPPQFIVAMRELDLKEQEVRLKAMELQIKDSEVAAKIREMRERAVKLRADAIKSIAQAESEEAGGQLKEYEEQMTGLLEQIFELEQLETRRKQMAQQVEANERARQQAMMAQGPGQGGAQMQAQGSAPQPNNEGRPTQ